MAARLRTLAAFKTHQIDASIGSASQFIAMEKTKEGRLLTTVAGYEGNVASGALFASNDLAAKNPDAIRAFLAGWIETVAYMRAHKAETVKIESKITNFSEDVMSQEYDLVIDMYVKDCRFDAESLATLKSSFVELKLLDSEPDMSKLYTEKFLPK